MRRRTIAVQVFAAGTLLLAACSSSSPSRVTAGDAAADAAAPFSLDSCTDALAAIYADPGALPADLGAIIKCSKDKDLTAADLKAGAPNHVGKAFTSGAHVYHVLYRTTRGDEAKTAGTSSAMVYLPDAPRATSLPVIVVSHGSVGQAPNCTPSKTPVLYQVAPLVGAGFAVIAPDLAGYANYGAANNPPNAYGNALDVGRSTLDGARALRKIMGPTASDKVVLVGHSQGGDSTLAALAISSTYGSGGTVVGVVAYAPLWLYQAWGALSILASQYPFATSASVNAVAIYYMYTHSELLDGAGHGGDVFKPEKRAAIKNFVDTVCYDDAAAPLAALGTDITDVYDPAFSASIAAPIGLGNPCKDDLCNKWKARFLADRPHLTGDAAQVPILLPYGGMDTTIPANRMTCVLDRLDLDKANYKLCFEPTAGHTGVVNVRSDYASDWIAAKTLGAPEPPACTGVYPRPMCASIPPND